MNSPFKFLDAYELKDRDAFFGRDTEINDLYQLVTQNRLTFVYGPSGIGKTSLVQCGLASRFDRVDWLPIFVRRGDDINASLRREIGKALGLDSPYDGDLTVAIDTLYKNYLRPVYLIFDQFEELFILGRDDDEEAERLPFFESIADLLDANQPCRILFIMREDYFGHLNQFEKIVPELYHRKIRVEPMSRDNLQTVITGSCKVFHIGFDDPQRSPQLVMDNILAGKKGVHMPYVQVYLHILYQEAVSVSPALPAEAAGVGGAAPTLHSSLSPVSPAIAVGEGGPQSAGNPTQSLRFTDAIIRKVGPIADVLGRFLQEQKTLIYKTLQQNPAFAAIPEDVVAQVLDVFVSSEGTKVPVGYTLQADGRLALDAKAARPLAGLLAANGDSAATAAGAALVSATLHELEKGRILRRSDDALELAHDTLAALIDQQRSLELRQLRDIRQRIETGLREHQESIKSGNLYFFDKGQLARIEPFLDKLGLEAEQEAFLEASGVEAERRENAEKEQVARELRLAEEKLAVEAQARKRQRFFTGLVAVVAVVAALLGLFAWYSYRQANEQTEKAKEANIEAQKSKSLAEKREKEALLSADTARMATLATTKEKARADQALLDAKGNAKIAVTTLLTVAQKAILQLNYKEASEATNAAVRLEANKPEVASALLEMAFFHNHTGDWKTAAAETAAASRWLGKPEIAAQAGNVYTGNALPKLRDLQKTLHPSRYKELNDLYFPEMVPVQGGTFVPGCVKPGDKLCQQYNKDSLYQATLSDFQMARTETTVLQYNLYSEAMKRTIAQRITAADTLEEYTPTWGWVYNHPVVHVSWYDAVEYANWASEQQGFFPVYTIDKTTSDTLNESKYDDFKWIVTINPKGTGYRLPTEAEWEFAGRGGIQQDTFLYAGGDNLDEVAWYYDNSKSKTHPVRGKKRNHLKLYDMSGNVWEWCWDRFADYPEKPEKDYTGPTTGKYSGRVCRGGSWLDYDNGCRSAIRSNYAPSDRNLIIGFRVAQD